MSVSKFLLLPALLLAVPAFVQARPPAPADKPVAKKINPKATKNAKAAKKRAKAIARRNKQEKKWPVKRPTRKLNPMPALGDIPFPLGEKLTFKIRMFNADGGEATISVSERKMKGDIPTVSFTAHLRSSAFLDKFYPIRDTLKVTVNENTFLPMDANFHIRENKKDIKYWTRYFQLARRVVSVRTKKKKKLERAFRTKDNVFEALSGVYAARRFEMKPGMKFDFYMWDGRRERLVEVVVKGKERLWTPVGWFDAVKVGITTSITGGFIKANALKRPKMKGTAWFGLDQHRTPLKLVTPTKLGDAEAILVHRTAPTAP